jgi:hypothetical protein
MLFFQLPWLPERPLTSGQSWDGTPRSTGMSPRAAARDAERMGNRRAARGALLLPGDGASESTCLAFKGHRPTLYLWSDGEVAIGPLGAAFIPRFVTGSYTYEVLEGVSDWTPEDAPEQLDALLAKHVDTVL